MNAQQQTKTATVFETGDDAPSLLDQLLAETHAAGRDTRSLSAEQRAAIVIEISKRLGLNPLTNPVQFLVLNGNKEVLYVTKTATDQIAARHRLNRRTVRGPEVTNIEGVPLLICQVEVTTADGRVEMSTATLPFNKASLITDVMKVETKAKRRATLSAVGLGLLSEDEIDLIPDAQPSPVNAEPKRASATPATGDKVPSLAAIGIENKGAQPARKSEPPPRVTAATVREAFDRALADATCLADVAAVWQKHSAALHAQGVEHDADAEVAAWLNTHRHHLTGSEQQRLLARVYPLTALALVDDLSTLTTPDAVLRWYLVNETQVTALDAHGADLVKMSAARTWCALAKVETSKPAKAFGEALKAARNPPPDNDPPTGTDSPRSARSAPATGDATSAPVEGAPGAAGAPAACDPLDVVDAPGIRADNGDDLSTRRGRLRHLDRKAHPKAVAASFAAHSSLPHYGEDCTARMTAIEARDGTRLHEMTARKRLADARNAAFTRAALDKAA